MTDRHTCDPSRHRARRRRRASSTSPSRRHRRADQAARPRQLGDVPHRRRRRARLRDPRAGRAGDRGGPGRRPLRRRAADRAAADRRATSSPARSPSATGSTTSTSTSYHVDMGAANLLSVASARRYQAVPVGYVDKDTLLVAIVDPANVLAIDDIQMITGLQLPDGGRGGRRRRGADQAAQLARERGHRGGRTRRRRRTELGEVSELRESADDAPVIKLVYSILGQAATEGASDIHFEPGDDEMRVRFRVDGVLYEAARVPKRMVSGVISRVKIMSELDIAEKRVPAGRPRRASASRAARSICASPPCRPSAARARRSASSTRSRRCATSTSSGWSGSGASASRRRSAARTAPSWSPARPAPASRPRSTRRSPT